MEFNKGWYCKNCEYIINKQKHQIDKKVPRQDHYFSTRLPYVSKKIREIYYSVVNRIYNSSKNMIDKLPQLKGKTEIKFYKIISYYYDEMNIRRQSGTFQFEEDPFSKNVQGIGKYYHEVLVLIKFLQTKPQVKNLNINYYELYYTVIRSRDDNEVVVDKYEDNENEHINFNDFIPNHYIGIKNYKEILR